MSEVLPSRTQSNKFSLITDLYEITVIKNFLENFSLAQITEETTQNIKEFNNNMLLLVNTKNFLYKSCNWKINDGNKFASQIENYNANRYIATEITLIIENFYNMNKQGSKNTNNSNNINTSNSNIIEKSNQIYNNFQVFSFGKNYENENIANFANLRVSLLKKASTNNKSDFLPILSQILNDFYNKSISNVNANVNANNNNNISISGPNKSITLKTNSDSFKKEFLRIIIFLGSQDKLIDTNMFKYIIKTFSKQFSLTFNFVVLENDFSLTSNTLSEFANFSDFKNDEDIYKLDERIKFISQTLNEKEIKLLEISKLINKAGMDLISDKTVIEFINKFDQLMKNYNFLYLDIIQSLVKKGHKYNNIKDSKVCDNYNSNVIQLLTNYNKVILAFKDKLTQMEIYKEMVKNEEKDLSDKGILIKIILFIIF